jgi:S-adenosylmethionine hydrolase
MNIISFLSDFGQNDGYVGSVEGMMLSINPHAHIINISHNILPFQIEQAAFTVMGYYKFFPKGTVHLVVVDPGVGGERLPLMVKTAKYFFVGPDNGLFSYVFQNEAYTSYKIDISRLQDRRSMSGFISSTFHARDVFGPVAALLSRGITPDKIGDVYKEKPVVVTRSVRKEDNLIRAKIISIDHFGNIITKVTRNEVEQSGVNIIKKVVIKGKVLGGLKRTYSDVAENEYLALWGSGGFLEIAVNQGNAAKQLDCTINQEIIEIYLEKI